MSRTLISAARRGLVLPTANLVADWDGAAAHVTEVSGRVSALLDQSGHAHDLAQATAGARPVRVAGGGPNGRDAIDFALNAGATTLLTSADIGLGTGPATLYTVLFVPSASPRVVCDGSVHDSRAVYASASGVMAQFAGSSANAVAGSGWVVDAAVFNGAASKHAINGGTAATGNPGAGASPGHTLGSSASTANAWQGLVARQVIYAAAHDDTTRAAITNYLKAWAGL